MNIEIRLEKESDYRTVEELTREAFWDIHVPGCNEHYLLHNLRQSADFIPELDFVALDGGVIAGNIVYSKAALTDAGGKHHEVITFGPVSVLPSYQKQGVGSALILHSLQAAKELGFPTVLIYGDPRYYSRFGFRCAEKYDICSSDGKYSVALMALPLKPNALNAISGRFEECAAFNMDEDAFAVYEATFPFKEKKITESQQTFKIISSLRY